ncbi:phage tail sheath C-terminal domain-containing protein [Haliscomenobacter sp.]|uniref:phage tail sheath C-terminal domain-containing protein n=1 Tax=Haliscomenobacter sp. TaxID=2717303 RepID=UPI003364E003
MALVSPGVQVTVIDETNYIPAATNSVPYMLIATAQNKVSGSGVDVAAGTLAANANKVYLVTSQRDLSATFGNPFFYKTTAGTPINGYELNEYGLLAAYSALGITNRAYVQRVDIDLSELTASLVRPTGEPNDGTFWLDTANTIWGTFEWNLTTGAFSNQVPLVITNTSDLTSGVPSQDYGSIGDYAVVATNVANPIYYKNGAAATTQTTATELSDLYNTWVLVGSNDWKLSWPTLTGANAVTADLTASNTIVINGSSVAVPVAPNNDIAGLSAAINTRNILGVYSAVIDNKLCLFADASATADNSTADDGIVVVNSTGSTAGLLTTLGITANVANYAPTLQQSANFTVPRWRTTDDQPRPTGSVWNKITSSNLGTSMVVKKYSIALGAFVQQSATVYANDQSANATLDPTGGGKNIAVGTTYTQYNVNPELSGVAAYPYNNTYTLQVFERVSQGATVITGSTFTPSFTNGNQFTIQTSVANSTSLTTAVTATISGTTAAAFITAVSSAGVPGVSAAVDSTGAIVFTQSIGGVIVLDNVGAGTALSNAGFTTATTGCRSSVINNEVTLLLSAWQALDYTASPTAPDQDPADGRYWYFSTTSQVDIMIQSGTGWVGYRNETNDVRGDNLSLTDPAGPQISATAPTTQSDATALVYGDLWIDTSNLEIYPVIKRWQNVEGVDQWVLVDNTDQTTENGVLFADARWSPTGTVDPITGALPTIVSLLTSNYLDVDAPDSALYPTGMLLFNTRRSGFNVKSFQVDYFNAADFTYPTWSNSTSYAVGTAVLYNAVLYVAIQASTNQNPATQPASWNLLVTNSWVTASGNRADGAPNMGRLAQRALVVAALKSGIDTSITIREEQAVFNLLACTAYPELIINMSALSNERNNTCFVVGDTPMRLDANGTELVAWATNNSGVGTFAGDGLTTSTPYAAVFYPSCQTTDLGGSTVVTAPSHMMVRTIIRSDEVSYPWLAPAGTRRGVIDNAATIGYINSQTGEFVTIGNNQGLRDIEYLNRINPITFIPGVGITNFGNKTIYDTGSALDRINVARLVAFMRGRLEEIGKQFLFEPNDQITRNEISNAINSLCIDLVAKRGIYDFLVVCDDSNNTPARIDANELWVDIAIEPVKSVEFIYIPLRLKNTGELAAGSVATATTV